MVVEKLDATVVVGEADVNEALADVCKSELNSILVVVMVVVRYEEEFVESVLIGKMVVDDTASEVVRVVALDVGIVDTAGGDVVEVKKVTFEVVVI